MAAPFPEAQLEPLIYMALGVLLSLTVVLGIQVRKLKQKLADDQEDQKPDLRVDRIGLSHRAERTLEAVINKPVLQSELPEELEVSKATVSNAVSELFSRNLVTKKKKGNTYLIEPKIDEIEDKTRQTSHSA